MSDVAAETKLEDLSSEEIALTYSYSEVCPHCKKRTTPIELFDIDDQMPDGTRLCGSVGLCPDCKKAEICIWMPPVADAKLKWRMRGKGGETDVGSDTGGDKTASSGSVD